MNWYVISGSDHLGPFTEDVLYQLYEADDINEETPIWQEGMDKPVSYGSLFLKEPEEENLDEIPEDLPPDLPPLPPTPPTSEDKNYRAPTTKVITSVDEIKENLRRKQELNDHQEKSEVKIEKTEENVLHADFTKKDVHKDDKSYLEERENVIIVEENINDSEDDEIQVDEIEIDEDFEAEDPILSLKNFKKMALKIVSVIVGLFIVLYLILYYQNYSGNFSRPQKMSLTDYNELTYVAENTSKENKFGFSIAQDKSKIWVVTNNPYVGRVVLKMKSLKGRVLTAKDIEFSSSSILKGKIAEFSEFEFQKGQKIVDGYYEIEVLTPTKLEVPMVAKLFPEKNRQFRFIDQKLISGMKTSEFDSMINKFNKSKAQNDTVFWEELSQKYRTLMAITEQIKDSIFNIFQLNPDNWESNVREYEQTYLRKYGTYFTNFVVENEMAYEKYEKKNFSNKVEVISHYTRLSKIAREVGQQSATALMKLKNFKGYQDEEERRKLKNSIVFPLQRIIVDCKEKIEFIQTK
jgi:hypothetical protein